MNTKLNNSKVSKHNQTRRGIVNKNLNIIKKSSGPSSKAISRKIEIEYKKNFRFFPAK